MSRTLLTDAGTNGTVLLRSNDDQQHSETIEARAADGHSLLKAEADYFGAVTLSRSGRFLLFRPPYVNKVRLVDLTTKKAEPDWDAPFGPDLLAEAGDWVVWTQDERLKLLNTSTGARREIPQDISALTHLVLSESGRYLAAMFQQPGRSTIVTWELNSVRSTPVVTSDVQPVKVNAVTINESGVVALGADNNAVYVMQRNGERGELRHGAPVTSVAFLAADRIVSGSDDGTVKLWSISERKALGPSQQLGASVVALVAASPTTVVAHSPEWTHRLRVNEDRLAVSGSIFTGDLTSRVRSVGAGGNMIRIHRLGFDGNVQRSDVRFDRATTPSLAGAPEGLRDKWQQRFGLLLGENGEFSVRSPFIPVLTLERLLRSIPSGGRNSTSAALTAPAEQVLARQGRANRVLASAAASCSTRTVAGSIDESGDGIPTTDRPEICP
jgi:WD40 repeat protein